jgi:MoaA/NifB/PqqE/SkfB family radical SAM enzyme
VTDSIEIQQFALWDKLKARGAPLSFDLELTARCNNHCRHCYIDLPAGDAAAKAAEMTPAEILALAGEAVSMGAVWCLLSGGEPLLREDFAEVYLGLKRLGLLLSVFTNACLVTPAHVELLRCYPPRDIEVSVYGATRETYERVSRRPGSYDAFVRGLDLLLTSGVPVRLKAMALRSTAHELEQISAFCRARTKDYYRFDPLLHLRFDGDEARNAEIVAERLSPEEVVAVERADAQRFGALQKGCNDGTLISEDGEPHRHPDGSVCDHLFHCGAGNGSFSVGFDGTFRLCNSLWHPATVVNVRPGAPGAVSLREAWTEVIPRVRGLRGSDPEFLAKCRTCGIVNLCLWCPAHAALETGSGEQGRMDAWVEYFCEVAHARAAALRQEN